MGGGGGSKTVEVVEYVYEDPKHSITSQPVSYTHLTLPTKA